MIHTIKFFHAQRYRKSLAQDCSQPPGQSTFGCCTDQPTTVAKKLAAGVEITNATKGVIVKSTSDAEYRPTVTDAGVVQPTAL